MMNANEPTTGEIVRALRCSADDDSFCKKCQYGYALAHAFLCDHGRMNGNAADRLESQEKTIDTMRGDNFDATSVTSVLAYLDTVMGLIHCADGIKDLIVSMQGTAIELTARAENAERERDAAIDLTAIRIMRYIIKNDVEIEEWNEPCELCEHHNSTHGICGNCYSTENFELRKDCRGLPQDGEGKK